MRRCLLKIIAPQVQPGALIEGKSDLTRFCIGPEFFTICRANQSKHIERLIHDRCHVITGHISIDQRADNR